MNHLFRDKAPISDAGWNEITDAATTSLREFLAARRLVDVDVPSDLDVEARLRQVQPLVEIRTPFTLSRAELDSIDRGSCDADLDPGALRSSSCSDGRGPSRVPRVHRGGDHRHH